MSVQSLRHAIADRVKELLPERLERMGLIYHKKHWRTCECSWCTKKREATRVIGTAPDGPYWGETRYDRESYRDARRLRYRRELAELEEA